MVINFNLMLVWIPMCKYTLTRLAYWATKSLQHLKALRQSQRLQPQLAYGAPEIRQPTTKLKACYLASKLKALLIIVIHRRFGELVCSAKLNALNSILLAADNCTSLHTICATTITIASGELNSCRVNLLVLMDNMMILCFG